MYDKAVLHFVKSNTHWTEVPRMLTKHDQFEKLMKFVESQADPEIYKWWGTYLESQNKIDSALTAYKKAQDHGSIVWLLIMKGDMAGALQLASES